jgi:hypothetical protein
VQAANPTPTRVSSVPRPFRRAPSHFVPRFPRSIANDSKGFRAAGNLHPSQNETNNPQEPIMKNASQLQTRLFAALIAAVGVSFSIGGTLALMSTPDTLQTTQIAANAQVAQKS